MMNIVLPFPPSLNSIWRRVGAKTLLSADGRAYRKAVANSILLAGIRRSFPADRRLSVELLVNPPDRRRRDIDNIPKAIFDALTHAGVWVDDSQVDRMTVVRMAPAKSGSVIVTVEEIE